MKKNEKKEPTTDDVKEEQEKEIQEEVSIPNVNQENNHPLSSTSEEKIIQENEYPDHD